MTSKARLVAKLHRNESDRAAEVQSLDRLRRGAADRSLSSVQTSANLRQRRFSGGSGPLTSDVRQLRPCLSGAAVAEGWRVRRAVIATKQRLLVSHGRGAARLTSRGLTNGLVKAQ
jgi:hypothetical protein